VLQAVDSGGEVTRGAGQFAAEAIGQTVDVGEVKQRPARTPSGEHAAAELSVLAPGRMLESYYFTSRYSGQKSSRRVVWKANAGV
jgi:hypothetical protein